ncbi:DUF3509 domain-containing protein [Stutzerimonas azotifigens]|uniref:DUF3509 domain-containing protein n=1 Tax=Stutzerimonas azotifigens TaxID=291995 RepID=UPI0004165623|nr:DUF3509 domain-containing protein [Stutzerimonas azotifigens]
MNSPFQMISDVFQPRYRVNFSIEKPDGSILLTLSDEDGVAVKRYIGTDQWRDSQKLERLIASLSLTLAIERGEDDRAVANVLRRAQRPESVLV